MSAVVCLVRTSQGNMSLHFQSDTISTSPWDCHWSAFTLSVSGFG